MTSKATRGPGADPAHSRFGESQFKPSRFEHSRQGEWVEESRPDAKGRVSGVFKTEGPGETSTFTGLTLLRPPLPASLPVVKTAAEKLPSTRPLHLPAGRNAVLLFHGLSSTPLELQFLARGLHRAGHTVRIAVIDGYSHGLSSNRPRDHCAWAAAALDEFDRMRDQCDTLAVGGLCIGALLSLYVAAQRGDQVSHVLALSTTLHYDGWAAPWTRWMLPLARVLPWAGDIAVKEREPYGLKDERLRSWIAAQMRESGGSDAGAAVLRVRDLLEAQNLMRVVRKGLPRITAPTLLIHAQEDDAASPRSANEVEAAVSSKRKRKVILHDSYHMISIDREKGRVLSEMKEFILGTSALEPVSTSLTVSSPSPSASVRSIDHARA